MREEDPHIIVCQGPPRCALRGDEVVAAIEAGCPFCMTIIVHEDGSETRRQPGEA